MSEQTLSTLETVLIDIQSPILQKLQQGLSINLITDLLAGISITNEDLLKLYKWKNGIKDFDDEVIGSLKLFSKGIMLSLPEAIEHYKYAQMNLLWESKFFPIFTSGGGDFLLLEAQNKQGGKVFFYSPSVLPSTDIESIYENLETMFQTIIACIVAGAYRYSKNNWLEVDYDLEESISLQRNPSSKYWN